MFRNDALCEGICELLEVREVLNPIHVNIAKEQAEVLASKLDSTAKGVEVSSKEAPFL
jgi:hypothetical protein